MRKSLLLAAALSGPLLTINVASALDTSRAYQVRLEGERVGTWRLRNRVSEWKGHCVYTVQWSNLRSPLGRTVRCDLQETKAGDDFDCERSRRRFFDTLVANWACSTCTGFDEFGQQTTIPTLVAGESSQGALFGIISTRSVGDIQSLEVL